MFLFGGFIVMSLVTGILLESADKVTELFAEIEEQEQLDKFFMLLKAYNKNYDIDKGLHKRITNFLHMKWDEDPNNAIQTE